MGEEKNTYAMHTLSRIALIRVFSQIFSFGNVQSGGRDNLVEGVRGAREELAGVAMARYDMSAPYKIVEHQSAPKKADAKPVNRKLTTKYVPADLPSTLPSIPSVHNGNVRCTSSYWLSS